MKNLEQSREVMALMMMGVTQREIGERMGVSRQRVHQLLTEADRLQVHAFKKGLRQAADARKERNRQVRLRRGWKNKPSDRFWENVDKSAGSDGCWPWMLGTNDYGYGRLTWGIKTEYAHRIAWVLTNGAIPEGMNVCHSCDNSMCCNPKHLFTGTQSDNMMDASRKGRLSGRSYERLPDDVVREARERYEAGEQGIIALAEEYEIPLSTMSRVINYLTYREATDE